MIDSHCHLDLAAFDDDIDSVIHCARQAGVQRFLIPGTTPQGWQRQLQLKARFSEIDIAFGLHPYFDATLTSAGIRELESMLAQHRQQVCAVGEIGLDKTRPIAMATQQDRLMAQLDLASAVGLPVVLHHRQTHHLLTKALKEARFTQGGVVHAFSGSQQVAEQYLDKGMLLGIGGTITYPRGQKTRDTLRQISLDHLLLETDAPDMPLCGYQGQRNTPAQLPLVANCLAELKQISVAEVVARTSANYRRLFCADGKAAP